MKEPFHTIMWKASIGYNDSWSQVDQEVLEKFAELIVRECVDKIKNVDMTDLEGPDPDDVLWLVGKQIREHFGVEE
jgi:hypothetical protein